MRPTRPARQHATCERCGAPIEWAFTEHRRHQALDPGENAGGNVAAYRDGPGTLKARALGPGDRPEHIEKRRMPHAATCTGGRMEQTALTAGGPRPSPARPARPAGDNVIPMTARRKARR